jgi:hypothetical protein
MMPRTTLVENILANVEVNSPGKVGVGWVAQPTLLGIPALLMINFHFSASK